MRSDAGLVMLVRCGDAVGHTQLEPPVGDRRNGVVCARRDLVCLRRVQLRGFFAGRWEMNVVWEGYGSR